MGRNWGESFYSSDDAISICRQIFSCPRLCGCAVSVSSLRVHYDSRDRHCFYQSRDCWVEALSLVDAASSTLQNIVNQKAIHEENLAFADKKIQALKNLAPKTQALLRAEKEISAVVEAWKQQEHNQENLSNLTNQLIALHGFILESSNLILDPEAATFNVMDLSFYTGYNFLNGISQQISTLQALTPESNVGEIEKNLWAYLEIAAQNKATSGALQAWSLKSLRLKIIKSALESMIKNFNDSAGQIESLSLQKSTLSSVTQASVEQNFLKAHQDLSALSLKNASVLEAMLNERNAVAKAQEHLTLSIAAGVFILSFLLAGAFFATTRPALPSWFSILATSEQEI